MLNFSMMKNLNNLVLWLEEYYDKSLIEIDIFDNNSNEVLLIDEFIKNRGKELQLRADRIQKIINMFKGK